MSDETKSPEKQGAPVEPGATESAEHPDASAEASQERGRAHLRLAATVEERLGPTAEEAVGGGVAEALKQYRQRAHADAPTSPHGRWRSIGPSVVTDGQVEAGGDRAHVSGRVDGIAYAPKSKKVYIATCNAGVWCRDDSDSAEWVCLMDARPRRHKFDEDPEYLGSDSLACGAIAVAPTDERRIYVGSGEPFGAVDSYHGVGPIVSTNAGDSWTVEEVTYGSTPLKGRGFFGMAVDPQNEERVVAATRAGIYVRKECLATLWDPQGSLFSLAEIEAALDRGDHVRVEGNGAGEPVVATRIKAELGPEDRGSLPGDVGFHGEVESVDLFAQTLSLTDNKTVVAIGGPWHQVRGGHEGNAVTSVIAVRAGGQTSFYAACEGGPIYMTSDGEPSEGESWKVMGKGFPQDVARVELAFSAADQELIYALAAKKSDHSLHSLLRIRKGTEGWAEADWHTISGAPEKLFGDPKKEKTFQGWYDVAIAVDPEKPNRIYLGGSGFFIGTKHKTSLYRCDITNETISPSPTRIGRSVHADIHALVFGGKGSAAPRADGSGRSSEAALWVGCDGGVFQAKEPGTTDEQKLRKLFESRNLGLSTMTMEGLGQYPTDAGKLYGGTQDNGGLYYDGNPERTWKMVAKGDAPGVVVNWAESEKVLITKPHMRIRRSENGPCRRKFDKKDNLVIPGEKTSKDGTRVKNNGEPEDQAIFYAPLVGTPYNPRNPDEADRVATGSYRVWVSYDFGTTFTCLPVGPDGPDQLKPPDYKNNTKIRSLTFVDYKTLYVGTMAGRVYRYDCDESDKKNPKWGDPLRLDTAAGASGFKSPVTCIAADPANAGGIYITYGGPPAPEPACGRVTTDCDTRRVWHYDPENKWEARSGDPKESSHLLNVHHSAIAVDPETVDGKHRLYAGADIGVWRSKDEGKSWEPCARGLPDAAVVDLKFHPSIGPNGASVSDVKPVRLRASTHGRGVFEYCPVPIVNTIAGFEGAHMYTSGVPADEPVKVRDLILNRMITDLALDPKGTHLYLRFPDLVLKLCVAGPDPDIGTVTRIPGVSTESYMDDRGSHRIPTGLAVDGDGNLYVSDPANHCVHRVGLDHGTTIVAGQLGQHGTYDPSDDGKPAKGVKLSYPNDLGWDEFKRCLYVTDWDIVRRVDFTAKPPTIRRFAGIPGGAYADRRSGPAMETGFYGPDAATVSPDGGAVYIPDDHAIRKVTYQPTTGVDIIGLLAGKPGERGFGGDGGPAAGALLQLPQSLQLDEELNYLFFCDLGNNRIRAIDLSTPARTVTTIVGNGERGTQSEQVPLENQRATETVLDSPYSCSWDKRRNILYVARYRYIDRPIVSVVKVEGL